MPCPSNLLAINCKFNKLQNYNPKVENNKWRLKACHKTIFIYTRGLARYISAVICFFFVNVYQNVIFIIPKHSAQATR